jgi:hypothetical protein
VIVNRLLLTASYDRPGLPSEPNLARWLHDYRHGNRNYTTMTSSDVETSDNAIYPEEGT